MLIVAAVAAAFWILALSPRHQKANDLGEEVEAQQAALTAAQSQVAEAITAKSEFPTDYRQLVVLGKAVPENDETASLLLEVNRIANRSGVSFESLDLASGGGEEGESVAEVAPTAGPANPVPAATTLPPTEAEAALLPLGATIGSAGLGVMPYNLRFTGSFFQIADFIKGIDSLIHVDDSKVAVDGRLVTLDGFALTVDTNAGFPSLTANFAVTTYLVPPGEGLTAGATPTNPAIPATTEAETTTGTPSSYSTESAR